MFLNVKPRPPRINAFFQQSGKLSDSSAGFTQMLFRGENFIDLTGVFLTNSILSDDFGIDHYYKLIVSGSSSGESLENFYSRFSSGITGDFRTIFSGSYYHPSGLVSGAVVYLEPSKSLAFLEFSGLTSGNSYGFTGEGWILSGDITQRRQNFANLEFNLLDLHPRDFLTFCEDRLSGSGFFENSPSGLRSGLAQIIEDFNYYYPEDCSTGVFEIKHYPLQEFSSGVSGSSLCGPHTYTISSFGDYTGNFVLIKLDGQTQLFTGGFGTGNIGLLPSSGYELVVSGSTKEEASGVFYDSFAYSGRSGDYRLELLTSGYDPSGGFSRNIYKYPADLTVEFLNVTGLETGSIYGFVGEGWVASGSITQSSRIYYSSGQLFPSYIASALGDTSGILDFYYTGGHLSCPPLGYSLVSTGGSGISSMVEVLDQDVYDGDLFECIPTGQEAISGYQIFTNVTCSGACTDAKEFTPKNVLMYSEKAISFVAPIIPHGTYDLRIDSQYGKTNAKGVLKILAPPTAKIQGVAHCERSILPESILFVKPEEFPLIFQEDGDGKFYATEFYGNSKVYVQNFVAPESIETTNAIVHSLGSHFVNFGLSMQMRQCNGDLWNLVVTNIVGVYFRRPTPNEFASLLDPGYAPQSCYFTDPENGDKPWTAEDLIIPMFILPDEYSSFRNQSVPWNVMYDDGNKFHFVYGGVPQYNTAVPHINKTQILSFPNLYYEWDATGAHTVLETLHDCLILPPS